MKDSKNLRVAMILAAGFGTRMEEYTKNLPKPLLEINSYPMICYTLFLLYLWKTDYIVINLHYKGEKIKEFLKDFPYFPIYYSEEKEILGTAGGIAYAISQNFLKEDFLVINPDTIFFPEFNPYEDMFILKKYNMDHLLYIGEAQNKKETHFYILQQLNKEIFKFDLTKYYQEKAFFYTGMSLFNINFFDYYLENIKQFREKENHNITKIFKKELIEILKHKTIFGKLYKGIRIDAGTKKEYEEIKQKNLILNNYVKSWYNFIQGWFG